MKKIYKQLILLFFDAIAVNLSFLAAFYVRFEGNVLHSSQASEYFHVFVHMFVLITVTKLIIFYVFRLYASLWRYASIEEMLQIAYGHPRDFLLG